jgi:transcriptional regulator with XRE-family HTH domain
LLSFGDWVKQHRDDRDWTQAELASNSGIPQTTISGWERKTIIHPSTKHLYKLAQTFQVRLCEIPIYCESTLNAINEEDSCDHEIHKTSV